jgi:putative hemolysin
MDNYYSIVLIVLILMSGFFSAAELAFFSLNAVKIKQMQQRKLWKAHLVGKLKSKPQSLLSTVLIGNNLVNISAASLATMMAADFFGSRGVGFAIGIMTFVTIIIGEVIPKSIAVKHADLISRISATPILFFEKIFYPLNFVLVKLISKITGGLLVSSSVNEEEISLMTSLGAREGSIEQHEAEMIKNVFKLNDILSGDIMTPRSFVFALDGEKKLRDVENEILNSRFSRIPVFQKNLDNIIGILQKDDALKMINEDNLDLLIKEVAMKPIFVPESKRIHELLRVFQKEKQHIAIVVDEYGGTVGTVTLEDVLEELVGEIIDEKEITEELIKEISDGGFSIHGRVETRHIAPHFNVDFGENQTISGFIQNITGRIPQTGEKIEVELSNQKFNFIIEKADERTIKKVRILKVS